MDCFEYSNNSSAQKMESYVIRKNKKGYSLYRIDKHSESFFESYSSSLIGTIKERGLEQSPLKKPLENGLTITHTPSLKWLNMDYFYARPYIFSGEPSEIYPLVNLRKDAYFHFGGENAYVEKGYERCVPLFQKLSVYGMQKFYYNRNVAPEVVGRVMESTEVTFQCICSTLDITPQEIALEGYFTEMCVEIVTKNKANCTGYTRSFGRILNIITSPSFTHGEYMITIIHEWAHLLDAAIGRMLHLSPEDGCNYHFTKNEKQIPRYLKDFLLSIKEDESGEKTPYYLHRCELDADERTQYFATPHEMFADLMPYYMLAKSSGDKYLSEKLPCDIYDKLFADLKKHKLFPVKEMVAYRH